MSRWLTLSVLLLSAGCHARSHAASSTASSTASSSPRDAAVTSVAATDIGAACVGCNAEQTGRFNVLEGTVLPQPVDGGVRVLVLADHQKLWAECGVHQDDIVVRVAGLAAGANAAGSPVGLATACAKREPIVTISATGQRAALCQRTPSRNAAWVQTCEQFFCELQAVAEPDGALLSGIKPDSAPWRCGLRSGSLVTTLGSVRKPAPDELGPLFDSCQGAAVHRVVVQPKPPPPPMSAGALRTLVAQITPKIRRVGPYAFDLDQATRDRVLANQGPLLRSVRIVPEMKDGKASGIRLLSVQPGTLLDALGFEDGDLVESLNGFDVTSPGKALQAYADLRTARDVTVHLERGDKPVDLTFHVR